MLKIKLKLTNIPEYHLRVVKKSSTAKDDSSSDSNRNFSDNIKNEKTTTKIFPDLTSFQSNDESLNDKSNFEIDKIRTYLSSTLYNGESNEEKILFDLNEKSCIQHQANSQTQTEDNNFILTITNPQNLRKYPPVVLPLQENLSSHSKDKTSQKHEAKKSNPTKGPIKSEEPGIKNNFFYYYISLDEQEKIKKDKLIMKKRGGIYGDGIYGTFKPPQSNCETLLKIKKSFEQLNFVTQDLSCKHQRSSNVACYIRIAISDLKNHLRRPDETKQDILFYEADCLDLAKCLDKIQFGSRKKCQSN